MYNKPKDIPRAEYARLYERYHQMAILMASTGDWLGMMSKSQCKRIFALVDAAKTRDPAAWIADAFWEKRNLIWRKGMRTRRLRSIYLEEYMAPIAPYVGLIADCKAFATNPVLAGTVTGRLSKGEPEMQYIHPYGRTAVGTTQHVDFSEIEQRAMAHISQEKEMSKYIHTVAVCFMGDYSAFRAQNVKEYSYLTDIDGLKPGDYCTVWSPLTGGPAVVKVVRVYSNTKLSGAFKYLIDKIDIDAYHSRERNRERTQLERDTLDREIARINALLAARKEEIRKEMVRERLVTDDKYRELELELQGFAQARHALDDL